ncbi:transglutaminase domain-containing protein, partial [bacterium]
VLTQSLSNHKIVYDPQPDSVTTEKDQYGNAYTVATWTGLKKDVTVKESFDASLNIALKDMTSTAPFPLPLSSIPKDEAVYLKPTSLVQSDDPAIKKLASALTAGQTSEHGAVTAILNWVVDNIKYKTPIPNYDAVWTLNTGHGNCQNYAHIASALLRSAGIPSRVVGGIALGKSWKVPLKDGALLQSIGQGGHAWMEVWFADIGWVPFDAQQSHLFVGPRHIKQTHGLDSNDINDSWRAAPVLPDFREDISAEYRKENIALNLKETLSSPENYIMTSSVTTAKLAPVVVPLPVPLPRIEKAPEPPSGKEVEFGNTDFPPLTDLYVKVKGDTGHKSFDKETSEYVTGPDTYAQAFSITKPLDLKGVSLAMHKFGGRLGSLWIDVVRDKGGRPDVLSPDGIRSTPLNLDTVSYTPGYKWFNFAFYGDEMLTPGKYWIILRHSKDAVVNWFYMPGNQYGSPDDARSTATGIDWSNIMNLDFNFKVKGVFKAN